MNTLECEKGDNFTKIVSTTLSNKSYVRNISKIVNFSWLLFASLMIGQNLLNEESVLHHNKRNCFPSNTDHYLIGGHLMEVRLYSCFTSYRLLSI